MAQQEMPPRKGSCLGRGAKLLGMAVLALGVIYFLITINLRSLGLPIGEWPRLPFYVYTASKITLTFDGQEIALEGTTRCRRRLDMNEDGDLRPFVLFVDHVGFAYHCGPEWFGHRFEDGSALLVGAYSARSPRPRSPSTVPRPGHFDVAWVVERISRNPPAVIWLDNAESPARAEYYYSLAALEDPRSRLSAIHQEIEMWAASLWTNVFTGWGVADPSAQVPAAREYSSLYSFIAHHAVELPKERWARIPGLREALAGLSEPTLLQSRKQVSEEQFLSLNKTKEGISQWRPPRSIRNTAVVATNIVRGDSAAEVDLEEQDSAWTLARPVVPETSGFQVFRFDDSLPRGAVGMSRRTSGRLSDSAEFSIGEMSASGSYTAMWAGGFLFDPADDAIYSLGVSEF